MSKIAILSDIHANLPAFTAVLRDVGESGATQIIFLGDIVGYGASPAECLDLVRKLGGKCVIGNHEISTLSIRKDGPQDLSPDWKDSGYEAGLFYSANSIDSDQNDYLLSLDYAKVIPGGVVAHACLHEPMAFSYIDNYESALPTLEILEKKKLGTGFFGHTHIQEVFHHPETELDWKNETTFTIPAEDPCVVMVGSVGQPRSADDLRACWAIWDPETRTVELRKTEYDRLSAAEDILDEGLPFESAARLLTAAELESFHSTNP